MISNIDALSVSPRSFVANRALSGHGHGALRGELHRTAGTVSSDADEISLSEPGTLAVNDGFQERSALSIRSRWQVRETEDGQLRATATSKLRFEYEFEAADGTQIRIRARANLQYSQTNNGDEQSQSLRLQVRAGITVVQQNVGADVASLQGSPEIPEGALEAIFQALELFQQVTDAATSQFLNSNPLDGDQLIAGLVDAFNELTGTIDQAVPQTAASLPDALPEEIAVQIAQPAVESIEAPAVEATVDQPVAPVALEAETPAERLSPQDLVSDSERVGVTGTEPSEVSEAELAVDTDVAEATDAVVGQLVEPSTEGQAPVSSVSVRLKMRLNFVQSLTSVVNAFDSDTSSLLISQSALRASVQIAARYSLPALGEGNVLSQGQEIDAHV